MYRQPRKWRAICPDGRIRVATETREPDVWFAANARIQYQGRTITGSVSAYSDAASLDWDVSTDPDMPRDAVTGERTIWEFHPYLYLRNGHAFDQTEEEIRSANG